ncbi:MAG: hypothetical protein WCA22_09280 [Candidatus Binatus sp.]
MWGIVTHTVWVAQKVRRGQAEKFIAPLIHRNWTRAERNEELVLAAKLLVSIPSEGKKSGFCAFLIGRRGSDTSPVIFTGEAADRIAAGR